MLLSMGNLENFAIADLDLPAHPRRVRRRCMPLLLIARVARMASKKLIVHSPNAKSITALPAMPVPIYLTLES